jgi:hypothetical protein
MLHFKHLHYEVLHIDVKSRYYFPTMSSVAESSRRTPHSSATVDRALVEKIDKNLKYKNIDAFTGERNKLQRFLLQLRLYIKFNGERFKS